MEIHEKIRELYALDGYTLRPVPGHKGGRNLIFICRKDGADRSVLRVSASNDRTEADYLAETEFVAYLAQNSAPVAGVLPSENGRLVERAEIDGKTAYVSLFQYARGMLISDNGYRYRESAPLSEYFYYTGRVLGQIHQLSKNYRPIHRRASYFDKYNKSYIDRLIPDTYAQIKGRIAELLEEFKVLPQDEESFGLVHFDFSDGNYHIDMDSGEITVFDFENCMYAWFMYDLANLWIHGKGWCQFERDPEKRREFMKQYFDQILAGYRIFMQVPKGLLEKLPLFIDMVLVENIVDEFEFCSRAGEEPDSENIAEAAGCLLSRVPYAGLFKT